MTDRSSGALDDGGDGRGTAGAPGDQGGAAAGALQLLAVAGNETTRNSITGGMIAFLGRPEQRELFKAERPKTAVDEIMRWATVRRCRPVRGTALSSAHRSRPGGRRV